MIRILMGNPCHWIVVAAAAVGVAAAVGGGGWMIPTTAIHNIVHDKSYWCILDHPHGPHSISPPWSPPWMMMMMMMMRWMEHKRW